MVAPLTQVPKKRRGVLLLNLGGPANQEAIEPFLFNLFSDPDIVPLPFSNLLQWPFAKLISSVRWKKVAKYYEYMGGGSPILPLTQAQAQGLEERLAASGNPMPVRVAMRYFHPFTDAAIWELLSLGVEEIIAVPLFPQYSTASTGSSFKEIDRVLSEIGRSAISVRRVVSYHDHPGYIRALAQTVENKLNDIQNSATPTPRNEINLLFSAHSIPKVLVKKKHDPYPTQVKETVKAVMQDLISRGVVDEDHPWHLCYQSQVGPIPWVGPSTENMLLTMQAFEQKAVMLIPASFVSEHLETLYEMDILYKNEAQDLGLTFYRAKALNDAPAYLDALCDITLSALPENERTDKQTLETVPQTAEVL